LVEPSRAVSNRIVPNRSEGECSCQERAGGG